MESMNWISYITELGIFISVGAALLLALLKGFGNLRKEMREGTKDLCTDLLAAIKGLDGRLRAVEIKVGEIDVRLVTVEKQLTEITPRPLSS